MPIFFALLVSFLGGGCEKGALKISTIILANSYSQLMAIYYHQV